MKKLTIQQQLALAFYYKHSHPNMSNSDLDQLVKDCNEMAKRIVEVVQFVETKCIEIFVKFCKKYINPSMLNTKGLIEQYAADSLKMSSKAADAFGIEEQKEEILTELFTALEVEKIKAFIATPKLKAATKPKAQKETKK